MAKQTDVSLSHIRKAILGETRPECNCSANKHNLLVNCLNCGRIICEKEGLGACLTCGCDVSFDFEYLEALNIIYGDVKSTSDFLNFRTEFQTALKNKDKLLEMDKHHNTNCRVIDDNEEHFLVDSDEPTASNSTPIYDEVDDEAIEARISSSTPNFDFAGRQILVSTADEDNDDCGAYIEDDFNNTLPKAYASGDYHPKFLESLSEMTLSNSKIDRRARLRIQDAGLQHMSDEGMCLSVQQPFASMIVSGIKIHEGRTWYTSFRGRLWIHAAAKTPDSKVTLDVENFYTAKYGSEMNFPGEFPTGCLLGFVNQVDCLSQEEYRLQFPAGECGSPYVFIFDSPVPLKIPIPMTGKRFIFKMDKKVHEGAKNITLLHTAI